MARNEFEAPPAIPDWYGDSAPDIEFKLSRAYTRPNLVRFIAFAALAALAGFGWSRNPFSLLPGATIGFGAVALYNGLAYCWRRRFRTRVNARGIHVRGYFNHFVPWDNVKSIEVGGYGDSRPLDDDLPVTRVSSYGSFRAAGGRAGNMGRRARLGIAYVVRVRGRKVLLRAPLVTSWAPDPYFDEKTHQLEALRSQYGSKAQLR